MRATPLLRRVVPALVVAAWLASPAALEATGTDLEIDPPVPPLSGIVQARLADTRPGATTIDGIAAGGGPVIPGVVLVVPVAGRGPTLASDDGLVLDITATDAAAPGFLRAWPCDDTEPATATLNARPGSSTTNATVLALGDSDLCVRSSAPMQVVVDLVTRYLAGSGFVAVVQRALDTRVEVPVVGDPHGPPARIPPHTWMQLELLIPPGGRPLINVTAVEPLANGYLTVRTCSNTPPLPGSFDRDGTWNDAPVITSLTFAAGTTTANLGLEPGNAGRLCVYSSAATHLVIDVVGMLPPSYPVEPKDSGPSGARTFDSRASWYGSPAARIAARTTTRVVLDRSETWVGQSTGGEEARASVVIANLTVTGALEPGHLRVFPCGASLPATAAMTFGTGASRSHLSWVPVAADGSVCVWSTSQIDLVVDEQGWSTSADQPLWVIRHGDCGSFQVNPNEVGLRVGPVTGVQNFTVRYDLVGGTPPYQAEVTTPAAWVASVSTPDDSDGWFDVSLTSPAGFDTPLAFVVSVTDSGDGRVDTGLVLIPETEIPSSC